MKKTALAALLAALALSGCTATPRVEYVYIHTTPPAELIVDCETTAPMDIDKFVALPQDKQLEASLLLNKDQYEDSVSCNERWRLLRQWSENQNKVQ